jgi:hypothetical protein
LTLSATNVLKEHGISMKKIALALIALCTSLVPLAQELSGGEVAKLQTYLFDELTKQNFVKLNRITKQGELSGCEAEFQYVYRDIRARKGAPVVLTGAYSSSWNPGKIPGFMLKINAAELDMKETKWNITAPPYINVTVKNLSFKPYKYADFVCETGGRCVGFVDQNFKINMAVADAYPFDATLSWSLVEDGMDNSVKLSAIGNPLGAKQALENFFTCNLEINQKLAESLKEKKEGRIQK